MKKRVFALLLAGALCAGLAACGQSTQDTTAAADTAAAILVCFLIMNALSFFFLKFFLKFLPALRDDYTSDKEKYGMAGEKGRFYG